jgi:hypothetical protein
VISTVQRLFCAAVLLAAIELASADDWFNAGPLYDDFKLTLSPGHRTEMFGPLFMFEQKETRTSWTLIPPLMSDTRDAATDSEEFDLLYPLLTLDRYGSEYRWQLFQVFNFSGGNNQTNQTARRFTLFPIYFQQRSPNTNENYTAVFPIYGRLQNRLFRDEIYFIMFPIYGQSRKRDVVTDNYIYPLFHVRHGDGLTGWQFWPIYGQEHKDVTIKTNGFGDTELVGGHDDKFVSWPIYLRKYSGLGTENIQKQMAVLPFYSIERSPQRDMTTVLWPFFSYIDDRDKGYIEWQVPWPLIEFTHGEGKNGTRIFPFYSYMATPTIESAFVLWPIYKFNRVHVPEVERERTRILFFLYSDTILKNPQSGAMQRRIDLWPFFTQWREFDGSTKLQVFSILEPFLPNNKSIERNYSPIWSVWRAERNAKTGANSQSLLWNLYRRDASPDSKKCSLLFGLFQYQSGSEGNRLRLFYIPVVNTKPAATVN